MKRRAFGAAALCALIAALTSSAALADNPHGTPPGQANQAGQPAGNSGDVPPGQAKQDSPPAAQPAPAAQPKQQQQQPSSAGVKPSSTTAHGQHNTTATADSGKTKLYGNGKTAGGIAMSRGASGSTVLYGPGNSQPHKVAVCKNGKTHYVDVHAVKSYGGSTGACPAAAPAAPASVPSNSAPSSTTQSSSSNVTSNVSSSSNTASSTSNNTSSNTSNNNASVLGAKHTHAATHAATHPATAHVVHHNSATPAGGVLGAHYTSKPAKPASGVLAATAHSGALPFTGLSLWAPVLSALVALGLGFLGLRSARARA